MAYFQGKVAFRQLIFGGYLVAITRILGYNTHRWMLIVYLELFTLKKKEKVLLNWLKGMSVAKLFDWFDAIQETTVDSPVGLSLIHI